MRDNLFRGKRLDNGQWVTGAYLCLDGSEHRIATSGLTVAEENLLTVYAYLVDPDTIGQYAFRADATGKEIFEGDLIEDEGGSVAAVVWNEELLQFAADFGPGIDLQELNFSCRIVGDIHAEKGEIEKE